MKQFIFWYRWLLVMTIIISLFGFGMAFFNQTQLFEMLFNVRVDDSFWGPESHPKGVQQFQAWVYGVLGATMGGWGISLFFITRNAFKAKMKWAWQSILIALVSWYLVDTAISLYFNVYFNAFFNTIVLILILPPVIATNSYFE